MVGEKIKTNSVNKSKAKGRGAKTSDLLQSKGSACDNQVVGSDNGHMLVQVSHYGIPWSSIMFV